MKVPLSDLKAADARIRQEIREAIEVVLDHACYVGGPEVELFEREFAAFCATRYCVAVNSGTAALHLILRAYGIGAGDEVITVPNSFIATAEAIVHCGARPVFVDIDPQAMTIDVALMRKALGRKTKAIVPVHLYGFPADMHPILEAAQESGLKVIEDACQAHGALYFGRRAGSLGHAAAFSFYPAKNLGAYGDSGAITTDDPQLVQTLRELRNHGRVDKTHHRSIGYTERMDTIQAAILRVKLRSLQQAIDQRRALAHFYSENFRDLPVVLPADGGESRHAYHLYVLRTTQREALLEHLRGQDIAAEIHYPVPIHHQEAFRYLAISGDACPVAVRTAKEIISLPLFPGMTEQQRNLLVESVRSFFQ